MTDPRATRPRLVLALLCAAQIVDVLDVNAVAVALPVIARDLGFGAGSVQWVVTAYVLVFGSALLLAGRLADLVGRRRVFVAGMAVFTAGSLACGLAVSPVTLVAGRAAQGLGAALVAPAALAIIATMFAPGRERTVALGIWTAVAAAGGAAGLLLGGVITDMLGWRWVFFINVPIGVASVVLAGILLDADRGTSSSSRIDPVGATTITAGLAALIFGLTRFEADGATPVTVGTSLLGGVLVAVFVVSQRIGHDPLLPLGLFRSRALSGAATVAFLNTATTGPVALLAVFYVQDVRGYGPAVAGLLGVPLSLSVVIGSWLGSRLAGPLDPTRTMALGLSAIAAGAVVISAVTATSGIGLVVASAVLSGLGLGCSAVASTASGTSAVDEDQRGLASGILGSAAQLGTAIGLAVLFVVAALGTGTVASGEPDAAAIVAGYCWAFLGAAGLAATGAVAALTVFRPRSADDLH